MRPLFIRTLIAVLTFLIGIAAVTTYMFKRATPASPRSETAKPSTTQQPQESQPEIPPRDWELVFQLTDKRTKIAKLKPLRTTSLPKDDLEARIWFGFGLSALQGVILRRTSGGWIAIRLNGIYSDLPRNKYQEPLQEPKSGWDGLWRQLTEAGLLTLPDATDINCEALDFDGVGYMIEYRIDDRYRSYMYSNPDDAKCSEAKQVIRISKIIAGEFKLDHFALEEK